MGSPDGALRRLLIVEDDPDVARSLSLIIEHPRIAVAFATNGVEAIARAREQRPHAMLLDVFLPVMDGFEVFRVLRRDPDLAPIRVIFMSAFAAPGSYALAREMGAYGTLRKPFTESLIRSTVLAALDLAEGQAESAARVASSS